MLSKGISHVKIGTIFCVCSTIAISVHQSVLKRTNDADKINNFFMEQLLKQNWDLREVCEKSLNEMEELKRFQGFTFDTIARKNLSKIEIPSMNSQVRCKIAKWDQLMNDSRDFQDAEPARSGHPHVASRSVFCPHHPDLGGMLSAVLRECRAAEKGRQTYGTHMIYRETFSNLTASSSAFHQQESNLWVSNNSETSSHVMSESQTPVQDPSEGDCSKIYGAGQQRLRISDLHFDKFSTPENEIQDWGVHLFTISCRNCVVDQRSGGWLMLWMIFFIVCKRNSNARFWSVRCENWVKMSGFTPYWILAFFWNPLPDHHLEHPKCHPKRLPPTHPNTWTPAHLHTQTRTHLNGHKPCLRENVNKKKKDCVVCPAPSVFLCCFIAVCLGFPSCVVFFVFVCSSFPTIPPGSPSAPSMVLDIVEGQGRGGPKKWPKFNMGQNRTSLNVPRVIHGTQFKRRINLEEQDTQKEDRFLHGRQIACLICECFRVTGTNDSVENYADLFTTALRNDDKNSIQKRTEFCYQWRKFYRMTFWKDWHMKNASLRKSRPYWNCTTWRFIRRKQDLIITITDRRQWWKEVSTNIYETEILGSKTEIMKETPRSRIRGQDSEDNFFGDCWQWEANGQCSKRDNCNYRHDIDKRAKNDTVESVPEFFHAAEWEKCIENPKSQR